MPDLSLPQYNLNINTPAPIIGTSGIVYKPGKFTTLTNPGLPNPYMNSKPDLSLKKPSELKLDKPKSTTSETTPTPTKLNQKTIYIIVGVAAFLGVIILLNRNNEK